MSFWGAKVNAAFEAGGEREEPPAPSQEVLSEILSRSPEPGFAAADIEWWACPDEFGRHWIHFQNERGTLAYKRSAAGVEAWKLWPPKKR